MRGLGGDGESTTYTLPLHLLASPTLSLALPLASLRSPSDFRCSVARLGIAGPRNRLNIPVDVKVFVFGHSLEWYQYHVGLALTRS